MIDPRAVSADVALDLASGCWIRRCHGLWQKMLLRTDRHRDGTEKLGLRAALTPIPWSNECARPQTRLLATRELFLTNIDIRVAPESERPATHHHRRVDVRLADKAGHDAPAITVGLIAGAGYRVALYQLGQRVARGDPARVGLFGGVDADLIGLRRINAVQPDLRAVHRDGVAIGNSRGACYCRGRCSNSRVCKQYSGNQGNQGDANNHGGIFSHHNVD